MSSKTEAGPKINETNVKTVTLIDFRTKIFDGGSLKRHVSREVIENPNSWYYNLSTPNHRSY